MGCGHAEFSILIEFCIAMRSLRIVHIVRGRISEALWRAGKSTGGRETDITIHFAHLLMICCLKFIVREETVNFQTGSIDCVAGLLDSSAGS